MKVSIITACYNSADTIQDCVRSVMAQDYPNLEYLVIDGHSRDQTLNLVEDAIQGAAHVKVLSEPDRGIYDALNKGLVRATGDLVGFVHSDDLLAHAGVVSRMASLLNENECDGVYSDLVYVRPENTENVVRYWKSRPFAPSLVHQGWMPAHPTFYLKREVYEKHGYFDLSFRIAADYDFMLRVLRDTDLRFGYLPEVTVKMRTGGASNKSLKNLLRKSQEDLRAMRRNGIPRPGLALLAKNFSKLPQFITRSR